MRWPWSKEATQEDRFAPLQVTFVDMSDATRVMDALFLEELETMDRDELIRKATMLRSMMHQRRSW